MTDEELGRAWCQANNRRPDYRPKTGLPPYRWVYDDGPEYALPHEVWTRLPYKLMHRYHTEAEAYAAVGAALRTLAADCQQLQAIIGPFMGVADHIAITTEPKS